MSARTVFLSRLIGLYCILGAISMMLHKQSIVEAVTALLNDSPVMLLLGVLALVTGLAMVLAHNLWSAGPAALLVTIVGWITLMKGLLFLSLPREVEADLLLAKLHYAQYFYLLMTISLIMGLYLTYEGFRFQVKGRAD
jgi:hypothetical protein